MYKHMHTADIIHSQRTTHNAQRTSRLQKATNQNKRKRKENKRRKKCYVCMCVRVCVHCDEVKRKRKTHMYEPSILTYAVDQITSAKRTVSVQEVNIALPEQWMYVLHNMKKVTRPGGEKKRVLHALGLSSNIQQQNTYTAHNSLSLSLALALVKHGLR